MTEPIYADPYTRIAWLHEQLAAAEGREAQLLSLAEDLALWEPHTPEHKAALDGLRAPAVQPPDTREPRCPTCGHVPPNPRCELCCEEPPDTREPRSQYWSHWPVPDTRAHKTADSCAAGGATDGVAEEGEA